MKLLFYFVVLSAVSRADIHVVSHWVLPNAVKRAGEITQERSKPIIVGDILYSATLSGVVSAVHRTDGYVLWQKKLEAGVEGCLAYGRSKLVVGDLQGNLHALNARDGSEVWKIKIPSEWVSAPTVGRDKIFVASAAEELFALSESTGKEVWHYGHRGDEKMTVRGVSGTVAAGGEIYQGFADGSLVALDAQSGKVLWQKKLKSRDRFYDVDATPWVDDQSVIAATFDGKLYHLDRKTGDVRWIHTVGSYGGFLVEDDKIYFAGLDGNFYALNKGTGTPVWKTRFEGTVGTQPAKVGEYLVFATSEDPFYVLDPKDGHVLSTGTLGAGTVAHPVGNADGWFYLLSNYGNLTSYYVLSGMRWAPSPQIIPSYSAIERHIDTKYKNPKSSG